MINDNNLSGVYQNALNIMIQGNEFLSKIITSFIAEMPKNAKKNIFDYNGFNGKRSCIGDKNKNVWDFYRYEDGAVWIARCRRAGQIKKDIVNLTVRKVYDFDLTETVFFDNGFEKIGEMTLFLYENNMDEYPLQVNFVFCVGRNEGKLFLKIKCDNVNCGIDYAELLKKYDCFDVVKEVSQMVYPIDVEKILSVQAMSTKK